LPTPIEQNKQRVPLSKERVLSAALDLADRHGFESLTMRKLAENLGVGAMSLYHYVPNKEVLLDGMVEIVFSEIEVPTTEMDWKLAMRRRAISVRDALLRHQWAVGLMEARLQPGPASLAHHNGVLGSLREAGFSMEMAVHANSVMDAYIYGFALQEKHLPFDTTEELAEIIEGQVRHVEEDLEMAEFAKAFPYLAEVVVGFVAQSGYNFSDEFEYGLDLILDGLAERLDSAIER
jgi:AcrR family transcriptional regulator